MLHFLQYKRPSAGVIAHEAKLSAILVPRSKALHIPPIVSPSVQVAGSESPLSWLRHIADIRTGSDRLTSLTPAPSVTCAWREPLPGWIDNFNGPTGLIAGCGKGLMRTMLCDGKLVADIVPVDVPINLMITAAWHTAVHR